MQRPYIPLLSLQMVVLGFRKKHYQVWPCKLREKVKFSSWPMAIPTKKTTLQRCAAQKGFCENHVAQLSLSNIFLESKAKPNILSSSQCLPSTSHSVCYDQWVSATFQASLHLAHKMHFVEIPQENCSEPEESPLKKKAKNPQNWDPNP